MGLFDIFRREKYDRKPPETIRLSDKQHLKASYDAAADGEYLARYYANADSLSSVKANTYDIRKKLMARSRYEYSNNTYCMGMIQTLENDIIGRGPRLQMLSDDSALNQKMEADFMAWSRAVGLSNKLRTAQGAKVRDGETFIAQITNESLESQMPVTMDIQIIEAEQVHTPGISQIIDEKDAVDGIVFDKDGNPETYHVLSQHPGSNATWAGSEYKKVPASQIIHLFRADRPGQRRGIPEIMPALPLYAILRNYTLATLKAAEIAAMWAATLETQGPYADDSNDYAGKSQDNGTEIVHEVMDVFALEHGMVTSMPRNTTVKGFKAEQPTTTYSEFKREVLREIARCLSIPFNVAAGDSSDYNYASGRLDHQTYFRKIDIDRQYVEQVCLDPLLSSWKAEWYLASGIPNPISAPHIWYWDGHEHVDPAKEATADNIRLLNRTLSYARYYGKQGLDWQEEIAQIGNEKKFLEENGLTGAVPESEFEPDEEEEEDAT